jgi:hypothetical protein
MEIAAGSPLEDDDQSENCRCADEPGRGLVPRLDGDRFYRSVFRQFGWNVQIRAPAKEDESRV